MNSLTVLECFLELQLLHTKDMFSKLSEPPLQIGTLWSTVSVFLSPQYSQHPNFGLSIFKLNALYLLRACGFFLTHAICLATQLSRFFFAHLFAVTLYSLFFVEYLFLFFSRTVTLLRKKYFFDSILRHSLHLDFFPKPPCLCVPKYFIGSALRHDVQTLTMAYHNMVSTRSK